jgi:hypothetical protein
MTLAEAVRTAQAAAQQHHSAHADAVTEEWEYGMHLSVTAAINEHGEPAVKAVVKEMLQLFNRGWTVLDANALSYGDGDPTLQDVPQEKFTADGEFDRMKARLVAGGDRQPRPEHAEETAAPDGDQLPCSSSSHCARTDAPSPAPTCLARTWKPT